MKKVLILVLLGLLISGCSDQYLITKRLNVDNNGADFNIIKIDINQFDLNQIDINYFDINYFDINQFDINQFFISDLNDTNLQVSGHFNPDDNSWTFDFNMADHNILDAWDVNAMRYCFRDGNCISNWSDVNQGGGVEQNLFETVTATDGTSYTASNPHDTLDIFGTLGTDLKPASTFTRMIGNSVYIDVNYTDDDNQALWDTYVLNVGGVIASYPPVALNILGIGGITTIGAPNTILIDGSGVSTGVDTNLYDLTGNNTGGWIRKDNNSLVSPYWDTDANVDVNNLFVQQMIGINNSNPQARIDITNTTQPALISGGVNIQSDNPNTVILGTGNMISDSTNLLNVQDSGLINDVDYSLLVGNSNTGQQCDYIGEIGVANSANVSQRSFIVGTAISLDNAEDSLGVGQNIAISGTKVFVSGSNLGAKGSYMQVFGKGASNSIDRNNSMILVDENLCLSADDIITDSECIKSWADINGGGSPDVNGNYLPLAGGSVYGDVNAQHGISVSLGKTDSNKSGLTWVAGREYPTTGNLFLFGTSADVLNLERTTRIRQDGNLNAITFYFDNTMGNTVTMQTTVWRKDGATYDLIGITEDYQPLLIPTAINTITFGQPISGVQEGDFIGFRFQLAGMEIPFNTSDGNQGFAYNNTTPSPQNFDWDTSASGYNADYIKIYGYSYSPVVVFIGDSRFSGMEDAVNYTGTTSVWDWNYLLTSPYYYASGAYRSAPYQVGHALNMPYQNMSQGGERIATANSYGAGFVNRFNETVTELHPKLVVFQGGINDLLYGTTPENIMIEYRKMFSWADGNGMAAAVVLVEHAKGASDTLTNRVTQLNDLILQEIDTNYPSFKVCDTRTYIGMDRNTDTTGALRGIQEQYNGDGLHFTYEANRRIAECVLTALGHNRVYGTTETGALVVHGDIELTGNNAKYIKVGRTTNPNIRPDLVIQAGGADLNTTMENVDGGVLVLRSGIPVGTGGSLIAFQTPYVLPTLDANKDNNTYYTKMFVSGDGVTINDATASRANTWNPLFLKCETGMCIKLAKTQTSTMTGLTTISGATFLTNNLDYNGAVFKARATQTSHIVLGNGQFGYYNGQGFTADQNIPATDLRMSIDLNGMVRIPTSNFSSLKIGGGYGSPGLTLTDNNILRYGLIGHGFDEEDFITLRANSISASATAYQNGDILMYGDAGLTPGNTFFATERLQVTSAGTLQINNTYTLPATDGTTQQVLKTDGAGTLTWKDANDHDTQVFSDNNLTAANLPRYIGYSGIQNTTGTTGWNVPHAGYITSLALSIERVTGVASAANNVDCNIYKNAANTGITARQATNEIVGTKKVTYGKVAMAANDRLNVYCVDNGTIVNAQYITAHVTVNYTP